MMGLIIGGYAFLHIYFAWKVARAYQVRFGFRVLLLCVCALLFFGPVYVRLLILQGHMAGAVAAGVLIFGWAALLITFLWLHVLADLWRFLLKKAAATRPALLRWVPSERWIMDASWMLIAVILLWGWINSARPVLTRWEFPVAGWPEDHPPISILQVSDMHLAHTSNRAALASVEKACQELRPDIIAFTGDLIDSRRWREEDGARRLEALRAPMGKFGVLGNHEHYVGLASARDFYKAAGIRLLENETSMATAGLRIAGATETWMLRRTSPATPIPFVPPRHPGIFTLLLSHQPLPPDTPDRIDLQLAGHTHAGQIFPMSLAVRLVYRYVDGLYTLPDGMRLYVNRGCGSWGVPIRWPLRPELTFFTLRPATGKHTPASL